MKEFIDSTTVSEDLHFTAENIDTALIEQAALYAFYAEQAYNADVQASKAKVSLELLESKVDKEIRDDAAASGAKLTEKSIATQMDGDERIIKKKLDYNASKAHASYCRDILEAFRQRRDMVIQIGVSNREERKGEAYIKSEASKHGVTERAIRGSSTIEQ
jgi:hypothetical protein